MLEHLLKSHGLMLLSVALGLLLPAWTSAHGSELPEYTVVGGSAVPKVNPGTATRLLIKSGTLADKITVDIWLPDGYSDSAPDGFPVVYAHDGQNLFDPALSFSTVAWELDKTASSLADKGIIAAPIIVGIHNRGAKNLRPNDYFPEKASGYIAEADMNSTQLWSTCAAGFNGDEHAAFVADELKPLIDYLFNTAPDPAHTAAIGSSMGGLAALYLLCEYPDVFGAAACMSTHWIGSFKMNPDYSLSPDPVCAQAVLDYMDDKLPAPGSHRLYLDQGTTGWDADYIEYEKKARDIAQQHSYSTDAGTLQTFDAAGAGHNEWYWQQRAHRPLTFLLKDLSAGTANIEVDTDADDTMLSDLTGRAVCGTPLPGIYLKKGSKVIIR